MEIKSETRTQRRYSILEIASCPNIECISRYFSMTSSLRCNWAQQWKSAEQLQYLYRKAPRCECGYFCKEHACSATFHWMYFFNEALLCVSLAFGWFCPSLPSVSAEQKETCSESLVLKKKHAGIYLRFLLKIIFFSSSAMLLRWRQTLQPQLCVAHNSSGMSLCSVGHRSRCSQEVD